MKPSLTLVILLILVKPEKVRKVIYDDHYEYEFQVVYDHKRLNVTHEDTIFWYKNQSIHKTHGTYSSPILHGYYKQYDRKGHLLVNGRFNKGRRDSIWTWFYADGGLQVVKKFRNGKVHGKYREYNDQGLPTWRGKYRNNRRVGRWVNDTDKDTLYYYQGVAQDTQRSSWIKRQWKKARRLFKSKKKKADQN